MNWVVRPLWPRNFPGPLGNLFVFGDVHCSSQHISPLDSAVYRSVNCTVSIQYDKLNHEKFCPSNLVFGTSIGYSHTSIPSIPIPVPGPAQGSMWERWRERGQSHIFQKVAFSTDISLTRVGSFPKKLRIWSEQRCEMLVTTSSSYFAPAVAPTPGFSTL